jgi:hypothetical protein
MKSPARIIADLIAVLDQAPLLETWIIATNMFIGNEPDAPDTCLTLYDTGGGDQDAKLADDMVSIQVRLRSPKYSQGYNKLQKIRLALEGIATYISPEDGTVEGIWVQAPVAFIGRTSSNHSLFTLNLRILLTPALAGNRQTY